MLGRNRQGVCKWGVYVRSVSMMNGWQRVLRSLLFWLLLPVLSTGFAQDAAPVASGETYDIALGEQVLRSLVASEDDTPSTITYHTYVLQLSTPVNELTISVDGGSDDVDLVTQPGTPITRFAQASYQGLDAASQHRFSYLNPPVGEIYIDVVNKTAAAVGYTLTVTADLSDQATNEDTPEDATESVPATADENTGEDVSTPDAATPDAVEANAATPDAGETDAEMATDTAITDMTTEVVAEDAEAQETETAAATTEEATPAEDTLADTEGMDDTVAAADTPANETAGMPALPTGTYGAIAVGETVTARIVSAAEGNGLSYHTYVINVPEDVSDVTISVSGQRAGEAANIDLVTNAGAAIQRFSEADFDGVSPNTQEQVAYVDAAGLEIYVDVVNRQNVVLEYTLSITPDAQALFVVQDGVLSERSQPAEPVLDTAGVVIPSNPLPDGTYGMVPIGNTVTATIAAAGETGFTYNTYLVEVTEALDDLVLDVEVIGIEGVPAEASLDLVVQQGAIIEDYDTADYNSFATDDARFAVASPPVGGIYYLDVVNLSGATLPYRLSVATSGPVVDSNRARDPVAASSASVVAPSRRSSIVGDLGIGQQAYGELQGKSQVATFHTYVIDVPFGTEQLELILQADQDLDIAVQAATPIRDYSAPGVNLANTLRRAETVRIDTPIAGLWYVDVINGLGAGVSSYTLEVR